MAKETLNYSDLKILLGRSVIVGLNGGTNLQGEVRHVDDESLVIVTEPISALDIETKVVHTIINPQRIDFVQFKTERVTDK